MESLIRLLNKRQQLTVRMTFLKCIVSCHYYIQISIDFSLKYVNNMYMDIAKTVSNSYITNNITYSPFAYYKTNHQMNLLKAFSG